MRRGLYGGTAGKARKYRARSRADKDYENLLLDDWREPEDNAHRQRLIPIRRRSDFLPAVACSSDLEDPAFGAQLDLPLERSADDDSPSASHVVWPSEEAGPVQRSTLAAPIGPLCGPIIRFQPKKKDAGNRDARRARTTSAAESASFVRGGYATNTRAAEGGHEQEPATAPTMTLGGFAYGCLLGSAAAAIVLVLLDSLL